MTLLRLTDRGLFCAAGDFYIDPWAAVDRAVVTHAHGDHVTWGCNAYLTSAEGLGVLATRLEPGARIQCVEYGASLDLGGVHVSLHPAGHILGSSQVRVEHAGEVWVVSGDYKTEADPTCTPFELVPCHTFVTESTFGLPIYRWPAAQAVFDDIHAWWRSNQAAGKATLLLGYALGKAQRLLAGLDPSVGPILTHGSVERMTEVYRAAGVALPLTRHVTSVEGRADRLGAMVLAPPSADATTWVRRLGGYSTGFASGWMAVRGARRRRSIDRGFAVSDHVDWPSLLGAIRHRRRTRVGDPRLLGCGGALAPRAGLRCHRHPDALRGRARRAGDRGAMRSFARLYAALDETNATGEKIAALSEYFRQAPPRDAVWAVHFLGGQRPKRLVGVAKLRTWAATEAGIPDWLFDESYQAAGDLAETITLLLPDTGVSSGLPLATWVEERLLPLRGQGEEIQRREMVRAWRELGRQERYVWNKLITGSFRVGASTRMVERALAQVSGLSEAVIAHRLMGAWAPTPEFFSRLLSPDARDTDTSRPYPFFLAHALEQDPDALGDVAEWGAEWKWDGIRAQLIRRSGRTFIWSRGEELMNGRFPEIEAVAALVPEGTVLDGELLPWIGESPLPFAQLQRRIGRKTIGTKLLTEVPIVLVAYELLEHAGTDIRVLPLDERQARLAGLLERVPSAGRLRLSARVETPSWEAVRSARASAREVGAEGLMLKLRSSAYGAGRRRGEWWKWKVMPLRVDAVLMYAQPGSGRRAGLFTDYTFGVWEGDKLVTFAKAYSGPTDEEIRRVDAFVRRNTLEKFGPVRTVKARARLRARLRGDPALEQAQIGHSGAVSANGALAHRQEAPGCGYHRDRPRPAGQRRGMSRLPFRHAELHL